MHCALHLFPIYLAKTLSFMDKSVTNIFVVYWLKFRLSNSMSYYCTCKIPNSIAFGLHNMMGQGWCVDAIQENRFTFNSIISLKFILIKMLIEIALHKERRILSYCCRCVYFHAISYEFRLNPDMQFFSWIFILLIFHQHLMAWCGIFT